MDHTQQQRSPPVQHRRQSWGLDPRLQHVRFFIGDPNDDYIKRRVALEQADHSDVHMSPWYTDSNSNDTLKVYDMLEWAATLPNITHLIKVPMLHPYVDFGAGKHSSSPSG